MTQYIDKAAVVAEIERLKKGNWEICAGNFEFLKECYPEIYYSTDAYNDILSLLDTLEVKEVNLEREIGFFTTKELLKKRNFSTSVFHLTQSDIDNIAKHFFELGLKAQKEE